MLLGDLSDDGTRVVAQMTSRSPDESDPGRRDVGTIFS